MTHALRSCGAFSMGVKETIQIRNDQNPETLVTGR
jgi:hypothetical protein